MRGASSRTSRGAQRRTGISAPSIVVGIVCASLGAPGCVGLTPQLHPADVASLETIEGHDARSAAYERERIRSEFDARGKRYFKGDNPNATKRSWQSLDAVLRSDANSAAALPDRKLRTSKVLMGLSIVGGLVVVAGASATAREALNLGRVTGPGMILLGGSAMSLGFGIGAGVTFGQARRGYEQAVDVYNESLGLRLGLYDEHGAFIPPPGTVLDEDGFMILRDEVATAPAPETPGSGSVHAAASATSPRAAPAPAPANGQQEPASRPAVALEFRDLTTAPAR